MTDLSNNIAGGPVVAPLPGSGPQTVALQPRGGSYVRKTIGEREKPGVSARRIENSKRLVEQLGQRGMTRDDMAELLGFSPSGVRKYMADLRAAQIIEAHGNDVGTGQEIYHLVDDPALIAAFIGTLTVARKDRPSRVKATNLDIALRDKTRHFHLMHDDAYYQVRVRRVVAAADPLALPVEFFKPAPAAAEPSHRFAVSIPAAPRGFPVPSASMFQLGVPA